MILKCLFRAAFLTLFSAVMVVAQPQELPVGLEESFRSSSGAEIYSVFPEGSTDEQGFMGYPILGRVVLSAADAQRLTEAVLSGLKDGDPSHQASCFAPRHGLRTPEYSLLICYACGRAIAESAQGEKTSLAIAGGGNEELARVVKERKLPWQGWARIGSVMYHQNGLSVTLPEGYSGNGLEGTEALYLSSKDEVVQDKRSPGTVVLKMANSENEVLSSTWIDHSESKDLFWLLMGAVCQYDREGNRLTCEVDGFSAPQIQDYLNDVDKPARLNSKIRIRPLAVDDRDLVRQELKLKRDGFQLKEKALQGSRFKVARGFRTGIEVDVAVGVVETEKGPVLVSSEVPTRQHNPLEKIVEELASETI